MYSRHWFVICLRYSSDKNDAADILQNALIKILTKLDLFDERKGSFKSWSSRIVVNENLMFLRTKMKSFEMDDLDDELYVADQNETPLQHLSAKELLDMIKQLPVGYKTVFNLYVIEGYSHKEIAVMLGISIGTSKSQLYKARKYLQEKLEIAI